MTAFSELSKKRQALILQLLEIYPAIKQTGTITLKELKQYVAAVKDGIYQQPHHPMFIYGEEEFRTGTPGIYNIPMPEAGDIIEHFQPKAKSKKRKELVVQIEDDGKIDFEIDTSILSYEEFEAECKAAGIV